LIEHSAQFKFSHHGPFPNGRDLVQFILPIIAISRSITFAALAVHEHPECRARFIADNDNYRENFVREVHRFYPVIPFDEGRAAKSFIWKGHSFSAGDPVLLDRYETNHDERIWQRPNHFHPDRFAGIRNIPLQFMPHDREFMTHELVKAAMVMLLLAMDYHVPRQDLGIYLSRLPTLPSSGFRMERVKMLRLPRTLAAC
jgi:fatty-acid peroxygenase